jgi:hypothetical protein
MTKHGLQQQRQHRYMAMNNPDFETKAADIGGLYLNSPARAAVFCVDGKGWTTARKHSLGLALDFFDEYLRHQAVRLASQK